MFSSIAGSAWKAWLMLMMMMGRRVSGIENGGTAVPELSGNGDCAKRPPEAASVVGVGWRPVVG